ncbi:amino acid permease-domain-containing protein [Apiospora arundinis]
MQMSPDEESPLLGGASLPSTVDTISSRRQCDRSFSPSKQPHHGELEDDTLPEDSILGRNIDWKSAYIIAISRVIGSGIFAVPGVILKSVGSVGLSLSLWVVGAIVAACSLAISLEYGCMLPRSGGQKVYLEFTYPWPRFLATTMVAVQAVLLGFTASNCIIFSQYTHFALDLDPTDFSKKALAVSLMTIITVIHGVWYKAGIRIQNVLGWLKVCMVGFMVFAALHVAIFRQNDDGGSIEPGSATITTAGTWDELWEGTNWSFGTMATSLFKVSYSYAGLNNLTNVLNEVKDPARTLRSASIAALATACLLYLLANMAYLAVVPVDEIKESGQMVAALFFERTFGERIGRRILPLAVALSAAGNVMVVTFALSRLNQEIARAGFLPFSKILASSKPFQAPMGGLLVHYIPSVLVIILPPSSEVYSFILEVEGYPGQFYQLALAAGLIWLRFKRKDLQRPFKAWVPAVVFSILLSLSLLAAPFFSPPHREPEGFFYATYAIVGISILVFSFLYWLVWTVVLPYIGGYTLEPTEEILDDGTSITILKHLPKVEDYPSE